MDDENELLGFSENQETKKENNDTNKSETPTPGNTEETKQETKQETKKEAIDVIMDKELGLEKKFKDVLIQ